MLPGSILSLAKVRSSSAGSVTRLLTLKGMVSGLPPTFVSTIVA